MKLIYSLYYNMGIVLCSCVFFAIFGENRYVDNIASGNNNGENWKNAWVSFNEIEWDSINQGDTIFISGGEVEKEYNEQLKIRKSGVQNGEIVIRPGKKEPHDGNVIINNSDEYGIFIPSASFVIIDGNKNNACNIIIKNSKLDGIMCSGATHHITLRYLEISGNGTERGHDGIELNYSSSVENENLILQVSNSIIHDNYQDQLRIMGTRGPKIFGRIDIFENEIYGLHDDGIECGVRGLDFYKNNIHTFNGHHTEADHPDAIVTAAGNCRVYSNTLFNLSKAGDTFGNNIYGGLYSSVPVDEVGMYYYNNLVINTQPIQGNDFGNKGFELVTKESNNITSLSDVLFANNTLVGLPGLGISMAFGALDSTTLSKIRVANNIVYNCGRDARGAMMIKNNKKQSLGIGSDSSNHIMLNYNLINKGLEGYERVSYNDTLYDYVTFKHVTKTQNAISGNLNPKLIPPYFMPEDITSPVVEAGLSLDNFFSVDIIDKPRPEGNKWDIGAYEFIFESSNLTPAGKTNTSWIKQ